MKLLINKKSVLKRGLLLVVGAFAFTLFAFVALSPKTTTDASGDVISNAFNSLTSSISAQACENTEYNECCGAGLSRHVIQTCTNGKLKWTTGSCNQQDSACGTATSSSGGTSQQCEPGWQWQTDKCVCVATDGCGQVSSGSSSSGGSSSSSGGGSSSGSSSSSGGGSSSGGSTTGSCTADVYAACLETSTLEECQQKCGITTTPPTGPDTTDPDKCPQVGHQYPSFVSGAKKCKIGDTIYWECPANYINVNGECKIDNLSICASGLSCDFNYFPGTNVCKSQNSGLVRNCCPAGQVLKDGKCQTGDPLVNQACNPGGVCSTTQSGTTLYGVCNQYGTECISNAANLPKCSVLGSGPYATQLPGTIACEAEGLRFYACLSVQELINGKCQDKPVDVPVNDPGDDVVSYKHVKTGNVKSCVECTAQNSAVCFYFDKAKCERDAENYNNAPVSCYSNNASGDCVKKQYTNATKPTPCYQSCINSQLGKPNQTVASLASKVSAQEVSTEEGTEADIVTIEEDGSYTVLSTQYKVTGGDSIDIFTDGEKKTVRFYLDANQNGTKDEGEEYLTDKGDIKLEKLSSLTKYKLVSGWNLVNFPFVSEVQNSYELLEGLSSLGVEVTHVATYKEGKFLMATRNTQGTYGEEFPIVPGTGYFLKVSSPIEIYLRGNKLEESMLVDTATGWNLIGIVSPGKSYTGEAVLDSMQSQGIDADTLSRYNSGLYQNLIKEDGVLYGNDFNILDTEGYFLRIKQGGTTWAP